MNMKHVRIFLAVWLTGMAAYAADNASDIEIRVIGSGKLDGNGISPDFFSDINVRLGFIYAWDEKTFLSDALNGNGMDPVTPFPKGLPYKKALVPARKMNAGAQKCVTQRVKKMPGEWPPAGSPE